MELVDLDLCVVLPVAALDTWVRADHAERAGWLAGDAPVTLRRVGEHTALVFRRRPPRPSRPLVTGEPRHRVGVVIAGAEADARAALAAPARRTELVASWAVHSSLLVIGGDLAAADVAGGTPVAGPHRVVDLEAGTYRVELAETGDAGAPGSAAVLVIEPAR
ncbi:MAG: hypothetical protein H6708_09815 [Kofleriaceae bacterium]|nr:hypothetical protein [Kofleriaceae bacterium]